MAEFHYAVKDRAGTVRTGISKAPSEEVLRRRLEEQGFLDVEISRIRPQRSPWSRFLFWRRGQ